MKRGIAEERQRQHRRGDLALPHDEDDAEQRRGREASEHERVGPAARARLDDPVDQRDEHRDRECRAAQVERARLGVAALGDEEEARDESDTDDRHVEPEDGGPGEPLEQQAADERSEADADARDGGPDADRLAALLAREDVHDHRQRGRHDHRAADAHRGAEHDQLCGVLGERGEHARHAEQQEPGLQRAFTTEAVAERAHGEQDAGERQQVGVDDPLQRGPRGREVRLQRRQRDVEHRVVEPDDEQAEGEDGERLPAARMHPRVDRFRLHGVSSFEVGHGMRTSRTGITWLRCAT